MGGAFQDWDFGVPVAQGFFLPDYVSPLFAQYLGLAAQVEVGLVASILPPTLDPRIAAVEDDFPSIQAFAHTVEPPGCPGTGASSSMDSIARVEPFLEHSVVEPGVSCGLGCPEILVQSLNQSGSSCWVGKSLSNPAPVKAKQVTFAYSVDFWFPGPLQFSLRALESHHSNHVDQLAVACSSGDAFGTLDVGLGDPRSQCRSSPVGLVSGLSQSHFAVPCHLHEVDTSASAACNVSERSGAGPFCAVVKQAGPCRPASLGNDGQASFVTGSRAHSGSSLSSSYSHASEVIQAGSDGLASTGLVTAAVSDDLPLPFAVFDEEHEFSTLEGKPSWKRHDFIRAALDFARLPGAPLARFLKYEIVSLPSPQVVLTLDHGAIPHRGIVFDLQPLGGRICTLDVTPDATVADALITLQGRLAHAAAGFALEGILGGTCVCHINGRIVNAWTALLTLLTWHSSFCLEMRLVGVSRQTFPKAMHTVPPLLPLLLWSLLCHCLPLRVPLLLKALGKSRCLKLLSLRHLA